MTPASPKALASPGPPSRVHPTALVQPGAVLHEGVEVGPFCCVGPNVVLHAGVRLVSHVVIDGVTELGTGCVVHPFAMLGGAPQHLGHRGEPTRLVLGPRNVVREHVTMHTGTVMDHSVTIVGSDGLFMVGAHVAHDCIVGDHVVMANNAALGGHVRVGDHVFLGGLTGVHQHTRIGRHAFTGGCAMINQDVIPFGSAWGNHAQLAGLNLVGLKRRGFSRDAINDLRSAYRTLFAPEGTFQERLDDVADTFRRSPEVMEVVTFIREDAGRALCMPSA